MAEPAPRPESRPEPNVTEIFAPIGRQLSQWRRRERRLIVGRAAAGALGGALVVWTALLGASWLGEAAPGQVWGWLGLTVVAAGAGAALPGSEYRRTADLRRQAERGEELEPSLRGALVTAFDRAARPLGSAVLLERVIRRAGATISPVPEARVWPATQLWLTFRVLLLVVGLFVVVGLTAPRGPLEVWAYVTPSDTATATVAPAVNDGRRVLVGDITLRYLYPTYTGLPPLEVPNSNGDVHAPPGTVVEVRARAAAPFTTGQIQLGAAQASDAGTEEARMLAGSFTVSESGAWRFLLDGVPSSDFAVVVEPDLPPDLTLGRAGVGVLSADRPINLPWSARDDFGLRKVVLQVATAKGEPREVVLREPTDAPRELGEPLRFTPAELGLRAGEAARIRVGAWDNDEVSGSKAGWSAWIELDVRGADGSSARLSAWRRELLDALVLVLADFLVEPAPPVTTRAEALAWSLTAESRYEAFDVLLAQAGNGTLSAVDERVVRDLNVARSALTSTAHTLGQGAEPGGAIASADAAGLAQLQAEHLEAVETTVLFLDELVSRQAQADLANLMTELAAEAQELQGELSSLSQGAALARLDQLERLMEQLAAAAKGLPGQMADWVNERGAEIEGMMNEIRKAIAEGRMEDAQKMMDQLARQIAEMAANTQRAQEGQQESDNQLGEQMKALDAKLEALQNQQRELREETEKLREKDRNSQDAAKLWDKIEVLAASARDTLTRTRDEAPTSIATLRAALDAAVADGEGLHDSARARDAEVTLRRAYDAVRAMAMLEMQLQRIIARKAVDVTATQRGLDRAAKDVDGIIRLLEQLQADQQAASPETQRQLQQMAERQQALNEEIRKAGQEAGEVAQQLPMKAPGLEEGTEAAKEQGERASGAMGAGDPMAAEGGQRGAEAGLQAARDALKEAQQNQRELSRTGRQKGKGEPGEGESEGEPEDGQDPGGDQSGDAADPSRGAIQLPTPEAFQTPEEYRRALLEGMGGEVPEEYRPLNRRYYEELVRQ